MTNPGEQEVSTGSAARPQLRLTAGNDVLDDWYENAPQVERNAVDKALLAVVDRSVFQRYLVIGDAERPYEFVVSVRDDLVVRIELRDGDAFGVIYVGSIDDAFTEGV